MTGPWFDVEFVRHRLAAARRASRTTPKCVARPARFRREAADSKKVFARRALGEIVSTPKRSF
jgi:hypothetical protein